MLQLPTDPHQDPLYPTLTCCCTIFPIPLPSGPGLALLCRSPLYLSRGSTGKRAYLQCAYTVPVE
jgi:hypothetical protein